MLNIINELIDLGRVAENERYETQLQRMKYALENREYMISFVGQFSSGKSKLINNIIGKNVLPVHITETTALVTLIKYGVEEKVEVIYESGEEKVISIEESLDLWQSGSTSELSAIQSLVVYVNSELLSTGLVIADTPGVNTVIDKHIAITSEILESSDKIVYVMKKAGADADVRFISLIKVSALSMIMVRTHMDKVFEEEEDPQEVMNLERILLRPYTDDDIFFVSNEDDSLYYKEIEKLKKYLQETVANDIAEALENVCQEKIGYIALKYRKDLQEKKEIILDLLENESSELESRKQELVEALEKLQVILDKNEERVQNKYKYAKNEAFIRLDEIGNRSNKKFCDNIQKISEDDTSSYENCIRNQIAEVFHEMNQVYLEEVDCFLGDNKSDLLGDVGELCKNIEWPEYIPDSLYEMNEQTRVLQDQLEQLHLREEVYVQELTDLQQKQNITESNKAELVTAHRAIQEQMEKTKLELAAYPEYEAQYIVKEGTHQHEQTMRLVGNLLDWATIFIPGAGYVSATSKILSTGGKIASKIPKGKKIADGLNKASKVLKNSSKAVQIANGIDKTKDIATTVKKAADEMAISEESKSGLFHVVDMLSFEYHFANWGKRMDTPDTVEIDKEYEVRYRQGKKKILYEMQKNVDLELTHQRDILDLEDEIKRMERERKIRESKQKIAEREIKKIEAEIEEQMKSDKKQYIRKFYCQKFSEAIDEVKRYVVNTIGMKVDCQINDYIALCNANLKGKIREKQQEIEEVEGLYRSKNRHEMENRLEKYNQALQYIDDALKEYTE